MKSKTVYLTIEEKKEIVKNGGVVPICIQGDGKKNAFIAKLRGTIFNGSLKNKRIKL